MAHLCSGEAPTEITMHDYIPILTLNDFIFCPYSIYLHNVYMEAEKDIYHATPQVRGTLSHQSTDQKSYSTRADVIMALPIYSERYHLMGKIDVYYRKEKKLVERKYQLKQIFQGQTYQLWAQMFCLQEMGYEVTSLAFYEQSTNKMIAIPLPNDIEVRQFEAFLDRFYAFDPSQDFLVNPNKCSHCKYCNLCDKTEQENVYL